ncbi:14530_t:CDS:10 [Acaulospora colombiana]|uniref:14530_t:CDS:1 n=1 Tax=Acaulospora colombiana TaxID=27376 RepID=A0ACA9ME14_9GLOM|nr:14530_t:CDS:10 [Acaulospora colombiana]
MGAKEAATIESQIEGETATCAMTEKSPVKLNARVRVYADTYWPDNSSLPKRKRQSDIIKKCWVITPISIPERLLTENYGVPIIDADILAREVVQPGTKAHSQIVRHFGEDVLLKDGTRQLDRKRLGDIIFRDAAKRKTLNGIVHPAVRRAMLTSVIKCCQPLEIHGECRCGLLVGVMLPVSTQDLTPFSSYDIQLQRLMNRDKIPITSAQDRLAAQMPLKEKVSYADRILDNSAGPEELRQQVGELVRSLQSEAGWTWRLSWLVPPIGLVFAGWRLIHKALTDKKVKPLYLISIVGMIRYQAVRSLSPFSSPPFGISIAWQPKKPTAMFYLIPLYHRFEPGIDFPHYSDLQHEASKLTWEGLYPQPCHDMVRKALSPSPGETRRVLDLANSFSMTEFKQVHDINAGLSQFHGMYDLIHCRYTGQGVSPVLLYCTLSDISQFADHRKSMIDSVKCLKPGGVIIYIDITEMIKEDLGSAYNPAVSSNLDGAWHQRMYFLIQCGSEKLGNDQKRALGDVAMGFWDIEGCDPTNCGGIEMMIPMGHWITYRDTEEANRLKAVTEAWTNVVGKVHYHLEKPLKAAGRSDKDIELLFKKIDEVIWGQAPGGAAGTTETLEMPHPCSTRSITGIPDGEFEFLRVYYDKNQWRERIEALRATQTPDMIALATVEGYDMIENL